MLLITREASVQFGDPIWFRVSRVDGRPTYDGWVWLDGYQLNSAGDAVANRSIFVQLAGLRWVRQPVAGSPRNTRTLPTSAGTRNAPRSTARRKPAAR